MRSRRRNGLGSTLVWAHGSLLVLGTLFGCGGSDKKLSEPVGDCCDTRGECTAPDALESRYDGIWAQESCSDDKVCVPHALRAGKKAATCHAATSGAEGRCLPACLGSVRARSAWLAQDGCHEYERCLPCFDPIDGSDTGACHLGDDRGATESVALLSACCDDTSRCVPEASLSADLRSTFARDSCESGQLCTLEAALRSGDPFVPDVCTTALLGEGRCLPACLPLLAAQLPRLAQNNCREGLLCAPCEDPATGAETGACALGGDRGPTGFALPIAFPACCKDLGHCVPSAFVPNDQRNDLSQDSCAQSAVCVPDAFAAANFRPQSCTASAFDAEGRCLPACLGVLAKQLDHLSQDGCAEHHVCAPCFDPLSGKATGSCSIGADSGPLSEAKTFAACCGDAGHCIPKQLVPEAKRASLAPLTCQQDDALCVPDAFAQAEFVPSTCTVSAFKTEGRCLPDCLPQLATQAALTRDGCAEHQLCAPCYDPLTGQATGSCSLGADKGPTAPPALPTTCCDGLGHCIAKSLIPEAQRGSVSQLSCKEAESSCVPDAFANADFVPTSCNTAEYGAEGRCLPACLPQLSAQLSRLSRASCAEHEVCAPCFDPLSGNTTGSCALGRDPGPAQPATRFANCCGGAGRCVPRALVPDEQEAQLGRDVCQESERLCVPDDLSHAQYLPRKCTVSAIKAEGRCLPSCLPAVAAARGVPWQQEACASGQRCAPCFDPLSGESTAVCNFAGDPGPSGGAVKLATCCSGKGRCTPRAWLPAQQVGHLNSDTCNAGADQLCVAPAELASDPGYVPPTCRDPRTRAEGRCLPACLPAVVGRADTLVQATCADAERCVPCFDPLSGASTGACAFGGDKGPTSEPVVFDHCCGVGAQSAGLCVPAAFLPEGTTALSAQSCTGANVSCVPAAIATGATLPTCSVLTANGVCIDACFVDPLLRLATPQGVCASGKLCVTCNFIGSAIAGCN